MAKRWSKEDEEYLEDKWGYVTIDCLSNYLGRTKTSIRLKAKRLKLCGATLSGEHVTANQVSKLIGIDRHVVVRWINSNGLKASKQNRTGNRLIWYIKLSDLMKWLKENQDKWDSRELELYAFGEEPKWLKEKRNNDRGIPSKRFYKYTPEEDAIIICLYKKGCTCNQIAERVNRSSCSVERRLSRLDIWGTGKFKGKK